MRDRLNRLSKLMCCLVNDVLPQLMFLRSAPPPPASLDGAAVAHRGVAVLQRTVGRG